MDFSYLTDNKLIALKLDLDVYEKEDLKIVFWIRVFAAHDKNSSDFPSNKYLLKVRTTAMNKYGAGITHKNISMCGFCSRPILLPVAIH